MGQKYTEMVTAGAQEVETQKSNFVSASLPFHVLSKEIGGCTTNPSPRTGKGPAAVTGAASLR